jgi:phosphopantetheinyl transferase
MVLLRPAGQSNVTVGGGSEAPPPVAVVDCHRLDLSTCDAADLALLDDGERARAGRFRFARDRIRFIAAHAQARRLLGARLGIAPADVRFATTRHGKPVLAPAPADVPGAPPAEGTLAFNLTHSGAVGYLAIASCSVGIDVELYRDIADLQPLIDSYCSKAEIAALAALAPGMRCAAFLGIWTRKEAALKAWGTGIGAVPLEQVDVGRGCDEGSDSQAMLAGLQYEGVAYPCLRLATIAAGDEVLSIAAACEAPVTFRMLPSYIPPTPTDSMPTPPAATPSEAASSDALPPAAVVSMQSNRSSR